MERLTEKLKDILNEQDFCFEPWEIKVVEKALGRFAAYEGTGLEPEEINPSVKGHSEFLSYHEGYEQGKFDQYMEFCDGGIFLDRLRELAQADREGRCVVLPCKKGDTVWRIVHDENPHITRDRCTNIKIENREVWISLIGDRVMGGWNFGKLLFLSKKEAEKALKAGEK